MKKIILALLLAALTTHAAEVVGTLNITRMVKVSTGAITDGANATWIDAKENQAVTDQQGVRTLKRSMAEVHFKDKSILRINERTDLVVQQTKELRNIKLKEGAVWIQVAKGSNTTVQTPTTTATAKGTIFIVAVKADGSTQVTVLEGVVAVEPNTNLITNIQGSADISAGETASVTVISVPDEANQGVVRVAKVDVPTMQLPVELGGAAQGWTSLLAAMTFGSMVTSGTEIGQEISQNVQEDNASSSNIPLMINGFITDPNIRFLFMSQMNILENEVQSRLKDGKDGGTLEGYKTVHKDDVLATFITTLYGTNSQPVLSTINSLNIHTVPELIDAVTKNGITLNSDNTWSLPTTRQAVIIPGSNLAPVNTTLSYRLIDKNKSSIAIVGMGVVASYLANGFDWKSEVQNKDGKKVKKYVRPDFTGNAYAFTGDPSFAGARSIIRGRLGKSIYTVESNYLIVTGQKSSQKLDSVALIEHQVNNNWSAFIGRKRYQAGPVIRNLNSTQLLFDRFTGAGVTYKNKKVNAEAAWLYDSNPLGSGAERGATAHVSAEIKGAVVGVNYLRAGSVKPGNGYTGNISTVLVPKYLEGYTEIGKGVDGSKLETYGLYFPSIYQDYDVDLFLEYGSHVGIGSAVSLCASHVVDDAVDIRLYADLNDKGKTSINGGIVWKFDITGNKKK